ncbi:MAG: hypothetical protein IPI65_07215 [Bacteroidetes bacterium]|nr:hypothetical protein [Bacteroidota bacterium]
MQGKKCYSEKLFVHFQLSDRVPVDNFYRQLDNALDLKFLYQATASFYGDEVSSETPIVLTTKVSTAESRSSKLSKSNMSV